MENKEQENTWRISYAEKLVRKTDGYRRSLCTPQPDSVLGIYMDTEGIHVRIWQDGESRPVLCMPAYYLLDDLEEILAGYQRMEYQKEKLLMMDFRKILKHNLYRLHITPVEANGEIFDPYIHEALQTEKAELLEEGRVIREIQKGYFFGEKLYRPARVIVSKKTAGK